MSDEGLIASLRRAVGAVPGDPALRLRLAEALTRAGSTDEALTEAVRALELDPTSGAARDLVVRLTAPPVVETPASQPSPDRPPAGEQDHTVDWHALEGQLSDIVEPMFVDDPADDAVTQSPFDVERSAVTLADVGGMEQVKRRLETAFLAPMRNADLRKLYAKSLRGGMLLYGPPGCGKTYLGKAIAGEMGAGFISVGIADILDIYVGSSEQNIRNLFLAARQAAPVVVFLDELDALGQKRTQTRSSLLRGTVNQLLAELDGVTSDNEGLFIIGATNQPWDIDPALRRPGRLDRTLLVLPPDEPARQAIFRTHLSGRPVEGVDLRHLARVTSGYSGADIAHVCEGAAELALVDSVETGVARMIRMADLLQALSEVRPSTGPWFATARNVVEFGDPDGIYDELRRYMRKNRLL